MEIGILAAFGSGLLSFVSPCILPIVPFYLTYLAGSSVHQMAQEGAVPAGVRLRMLAAASFFSLGMISVFVLLGLVSTSLGQMLRDYFEFLRWIAAALILLMGLHFLGVLRFSVLLRQMGWHSAGGEASSLAGAYVLGLSFAFGWTPCVGPILTAILFVAAGQDTVSQGAFLLIAYGLGMTLPFILASVFVVPFLKWMRRIAPKLKRVERVMGLFLILFAALIATDSVAFIANWILQYVPGFARIG